MCLLKTLVLIRVMSQNSVRGDENISFFLLEVLSRCLGERHHTLMVEKKIQP